MAVSIEWGTKIISVPRTDMLLVQSVPSEIRELDIDAFRRELKGLESSEEGMPFPDTHRHNTIVTLSGVTYARVIEIINGYTITFEDGQYAVNLVGANSNIADVTNVNQVSVRSANSAGLTYSKEVEDQSYLDGRIWIDTNNGRAGTQYPRGTPSDPLDNVSDANFIINARNMRHRYWLDGNITLRSDNDTDPQDWMGSAPVNASIYLDGVSTARSIFRRVALTGACNGNFSLQDGVLQDVNNFEGDASTSGIGGTITLPSGVLTQLYTFHKCFSIVPGTGTPFLDFNNATNIMMQFRGYTGGMTFLNLNDPSAAITVDLDSGHLKLDASCVAGTVVVRGDGHITNNAPDTLTVVREGLSYAANDKLLTKKEWIALK